eukprot:XP_001696882.1 cation/hydrogen exchanger, NhaP-type [Chlamydomonas reinhardtii]
MRPSSEPGPRFPTSMDPAAAAALSQTAFLGILLLAVLSGYAIRRTRFQWATEGSVALLLGLVAGAGLFGYYYLTDPNHRIPRRLVTFDEDVFFQTLLPPIIFSAGFSVKKKLFFRNFFTLMIFGVLGTMVSAGILASGSLGLMTAVGLPLHGLLRMSLALGSVLSCTDSVASLSVLDGERHPLLYSLLFGEGVVNDATAIVLLGSVSNLNAFDESQALGLSGLWALALQFLRLFVLSTALGLGVGMASAALVRRLFRRPGAPSPASAPAAGGAAAAAAGSDHGGSGSSNQEVLAVALLGLVAYFLAEALDLSAILSVFFCGIAMSHYTWHSLSPAAKVITRHGFHVISSACEVTLFVYAGLDVWVTAVWWRPDVSRRYLLAAVLLAAGLLAMMAAARAAFTFPVCWLANRLWRRADPIPAGGASVLWWGGLPRGAITLALAYHCFYKDASECTCRLAHTGPLRHQARGAGCHLRRHPGGCDHHGRVRRHHAARHAGLHQPGCQQARTRRRPDAGALTPRGPRRPPHPRLQPPRHRTGARRTSRIRLAGTVAAAVSSAVSGKGDAGCAAFGGGGGWRRRRRRAGGSSHGG